MDERESPISLALVRILLASVMLADWIQAIRLDLVLTLWGPASEGGISAASQSADPPLFFAIFGATPTSSMWLFGIVLAATVTLLVGLFSRVSALVLALGSAQLAYTHGFGDRGIDVAMRLYLLILSCSQCGAIWSIDARIRSGSWNLKVLIPAWPRYVLAAQLIWIYFSAGIHKTQAAWWPAGDCSALYIVLQDPHFARADFTQYGLDALYPFTQIATFSTMLFEVGAPLMLLAMWYRRTEERPGRLRHFFNRIRLREMWLVLGVSFHLGLVFTLRLGIFPFGMLSVYPALLRPEELRSFIVRRIRS